jgi:hypothetical protein
MAGTVGRWRARGGGLRTQATRANRVAQHASQENGACSEREGRARVRLAGLRRGEGDWGRRSPHGSLRVRARVRVRARSSTLPWPPARAQRRARRRGGAGAGLSSDYCSCSCSSSSSCCSSSCSCSCSCCRGRLAQAPARRRPPLGAPHTLDARLMHARYTLDARSMHARCTRADRAPRAARAASLGAGAYLGPPSVASPWPTTVVQGPLATVL